MVVFVEKRLYSGKVVVVNLEMLFYWGKSSCIRENLLYLGKSGCIWAKWLYSGKSSCNRAKVVVFG